MNIVFAGNTEFDPQIGGTERVSVTLAYHLKQHGFGVYFVGLERHPYPKPYTPVAKHIYLPNESDMCCEENVRCFMDFVIEKKIDVILNQFGNVSQFFELCAIVKKRTRVKLFSAIHTDPAYEKKLYQADISLLETPSYLIRQIKFYLKKIITFKLKRSKKLFSALYNHLYQENDAVILLSEKYKPVFKEISGLTDISKLEAIANPLSFPPSVESYQKEKQILWIGRFDSLTKRPERLVQIWSYLEKRHPDWNVLFLGDGPCKSKVMKLIERLGLKNVRFEGNTNPINAYQKSSIFCLTSTFEGFGLVLTEAMQFGVVPIAFSSYESVYDVIDDGVTGYTIQPFDLKLYAHRLESLMMDENKRIVMARNAREYVTDKFAVDRITQQWMSLFNRIVNN